ncbi:hypothetical protein D3C86_1944840 [compost metagenome]
MIGIVMPGAVLSSTWLFPYDIRLVVLEVTPVALPVIIELLTRMIAGAPARLRPTPLLNEFERSMLSVIGPVALWDTTKPE